MPGIYRYPLCHLLKEVESLVALGIPAVDLFTVVPSELKDPLGTEALNEKNLLCRAVRLIKSAFPELCVMVDVALDPFTDHGHDGVVDAAGQILNDETVQQLVGMSTLAAAAGADVIAPSDMMDGRVAAIRTGLDENGFQDCSILAYSAKYASAFYGPFRDALGSAPKFGDKKSYQLQSANVREALLEAELDVQEGADMLLVKPALAYLDIIYRLKETSNLPVGAYHVSGEYAMLLAAAEKGWIDADRALAESLIAIKRAGADFIFTYAAHRVFGGS
jgi:porphobilinogen synthase